MQVGKISLTKAAGWIIFGLGGASIIGSIFYNSQILAFIGLGLTFWGIVLTYIQTEEYIKESLLNATAASSLAALNQIITELGYEEKAIYLPPKYLKDPEDSKAYIPKNKTSKLLTQEQMLEKDTLFIENPKGILITPPGSELTKLFEKTLKTSFTRVDLRYLQLNMPKLFIEDLEISENLEISMENNTIYVKIEKTLYQNLTKEVEKFTKLYESLGCPLSSAIACALAKATGKPIIIEKQKVNEENRILEIEYQIIEEEQTHN